MFEKGKVTAHNPAGTQNERRLWHGTASDVIDEIVAAGYNRGFNGRNGMSTFFMYYEVLHTYKPVYILLF